MGPGHNSFRNAQASRRRFMAGGVAALTALGVRGPRAWASSPGARVDETRVISHQSHLYHGWPTVARQPDGRLIVAWSGGRQEHVCPFGRVDIMHSDDSGVSWTWPRTIHDGPIDDRDAGLLVTRQGTWLATTFSSLAYVPALQRMEENAESSERYAQWNAVHQRMPNGAHKEMLGTWMLRSTDAGRTWSAAYRVPLNSPHGPVELASGKLLYAGKALWDSPAVVGISTSDDDGKTWSTPAPLPVREGDDPANYHELHAVEAAEGRIVVHIRNHNPANDRETLQCVSEDAGATWSTPEAIGVWGLPSHLLRLADGRLLMSYGHRRAPLGIQARLSEDAGATWSEPLILTSDGTSSDLGYPSTVQLDDGSLITVWYERLASQAQAVLRQATWRLR